MDARAIRRFAQRHWSEATSSKAAYWAERFRRDWRSTWNASQVLLVHARTLNPGFPCDRDREQDLAGHLALKARLDRAANVFTGR